MRAHDFSINRRALLKAAAFAPLATLPGIAIAASPAPAGLTSITRGAVPIGRDERHARIGRAQELMQRQRIGAIIVEPGSSLDYFTGVRWHRSERLTAAVIPAAGDPIIITPYFEEPSVRETLGVTAQVRVWQEDEDPIKLVADALRERNFAGLPVGIEETVRFFASNGIARALPSISVESANPVVRGVRMIKTPAELALMQAASDVTIAAYRSVIPRIREGMTPAEIAKMMNDATTALGGEPEFALILLGEASAYPHGSGKPQAVRDGNVVLMDCGCTVHGYQSDISRSFVFGKASAEQRMVWDQVAQGQQIARAAAKVGVPAGNVDDAVRQQYQAWGYGPGYKLPGLSHRTGHGIGMDGHEPVNLVHGEATLLAPGMCFSNEPGIYIPGKFGIRLEDCFHMTDAGPEWFSTPPTSIDAPLG
ncbi:MAG: Xaa-Pro peptidase family protein [Sphingomonas sp.]|nr:Xaa-Pro peptidase family protein [Sphingomonas sp.]